MLIHKYFINKKSNKAEFLAIFKSQKEIDAFTSLYCKDCKLTFDKWNIYTFSINKESGIQFKNVETFQAYLENGCPEDATLLDLLKIFHNVTINGYEVIDLYNEYVFATQEERDWINQQIADGCKDNKFVYPYWLRLLDD